MMVISERIRTIREQKKLSQGDIEQRTGLLRCYVSRVENGHTVPAVETLEKFARALEVRLYQLLYDGPNPPELPAGHEHRSDGVEWGSMGKGAPLLQKLRRNLSRMSERDRALVMSTLLQMTKQNHSDSKKNHKSKSVS